jgi:hypothetical protein
MEQRKGPSGANAPPVHGIKKCLGEAFKRIKALPPRNPDRRTTVEVLVNQISSVSL